MMFSSWRFGREKKVVLKDEGRTIVLSFGPVSFMSLLPVEPMFRRMREEIIVVQSVGVGKKSGVVWHSWFRWVTFYISFLRQVLPYIGPCSRSSKLRGSARWRWKGKHSLRICFSRFAQTQSTWVEDHICTHSRKKNMSWRRLKATQKVKGSRKEEMYTCCWAADYL